MRSANANGTVISVAMVPEQASNMIKLESSDGQKFEVPENVAQQSITLQQMLQDLGSKETLTLYNVKKDIVPMILQRTELAHQPKVNPKAATFLAID